MVKTSKIETHNEMPCPPSKDGPPTAFEHWGKKPVTPGDHSERAWYITGVYDSVNVFCSCGQWYGHGSLYAGTTQELQKLLIEEHEKHKLNPEV